MLAVSGELDRAHWRALRSYPTLGRRKCRGGREARADARRRSVYLQQRRTQVMTFLELFDAPSITSTCSLRNASTVPLQALALLNSDFARRVRGRLPSGFDRKLAPSPTVWPWPFAWLLVVLHARKSRLGGGSLSGQTEVPLCGKRCGSEGVDRFVPDAAGQQRLCVYGVIAVSGRENPDVRRQADESSQLPGHYAGCLGGWPWQIFLLPRSRHVPPTRWPPNGRTIRRKPGRSSVCSSTAARARWTCSTPSPS